MDDSLTYFKSILDINEHLWDRMQKANKRLKFDRRRSVCQTQLFQRQLDENLLQLQRQIRSTRESQKSIRPSQLNRIKLAELKRLDLAAHASQLLWDQTQKSRPNSAQILQDIKKSKDQEQLNKVIIPRREKSLVVDKDFAIDFKKLELEKRDLRRSMLYEVTMLASLQISEAASEEEQALPGDELQAL